MKISISVTNNLSFPTPISLFGGFQDSMGQNVNAVTQYWWDIAYPFFDVALYSTVTLEYRPVGSLIYSLVTIPTYNTYDGLLRGLNELNMGIFWYEFPIFNPALGYQIYTVNDNIEFGNFGF